MTSQLLCELHAHTTWSDGELTIHELVDLYGRAGFDVLAITDHVLRRDEAVRGTTSAVVESTYDAYLEAIQTEAERAMTQYRLVVVPGLELTYDDPDPREAAHALALGLRRFVGLTGGFDRALEEARNAGAALIAAHPYTTTDGASAPRATGRFAADPNWAAAAVDRFEICNRFTFFDWVGELRLPVVATGDFHRPEHLASWKTLLPVEQNEQAVVEYLHSTRPAALTVFDPATESLGRAA